MIPKSIQDALTREAVLALLTDEEVMRVSRAEDAKRLIEGEYVDLQHLEAGIQQSPATPRTVPGHALPRSAVSDATWTKIVRRLNS